MGTSRGNFVKYPRTPHLFGLTGTPDDEHLGERESAEFLAADSLIVAEKIAGTNVGIHFSDDGKLVLQCRGHLITEGMHPQYDLFKQWVAGKQHVLAEHLKSRFILYGEWVYAKHTIHYQKLPHYFFEFDVYDKTAQVFLSLDQRVELLEGLTIHSVPIVHTGPTPRNQLGSLIRVSRFDGRFENPETNRIDHLMEGLYLRTESDGVVTGRAKFVRPEFIKKAKQSTHWQYQVMVPNLLVEGADIWS
jgi:RNA ligase